MPGRIERKWRPTLSLVFLMTLAAVLVTPLLTLVVLRVGLPDLRYRHVVVILVLVVALTTLALGWMLWRILYRPLRAMAAQSLAIAAGQPGALDALPHYGTRETERLGDALLTMGRTLQGREAVLRSYADHATHELKSPLTVLRGAAELLEADDLSPEDRRRLLGRIDEAADRMTALLDAQRALARAQNPMMAGVARVSVLLPGLRRDHPGIALDLESDAELPLSAEGLRLVLDHLIGNAVRAGAGRVVLTATDDRLTVQDDGPGISAGNRERIFDPFFTTNRADGGTGMGLPIVRRMLEAHGATIRLADSDGGARFEIGF